MEQWASGGAPSGLICVLKENNRERKVPSNELQRAVLALLLPHDCFEIGLHPRGNGGAVGQPEASPIIEWQKLRVRKGVGGLHSVVRSGVHKLCPKTTVP